MTARMLAQVLALDFANGDTGQCNPGRSKLAAHMGVSEATIKRAIAELTATGWLASTSGTARNRTASFTFLSPGKVVNFAPPTAANAGQKRPTIPSERGSNLHGTRVKSAPPHIKDEPRKEPKRAGERPYAHLRFIVKANSDAVDEFNDWASDRGLRPLSELTELHVPDGYDLPTRRPTRDTTSLETQALVAVWTWASDLEDDQQARASA